MKPLQAIAMGYVFIALYARFGGYDAYADPLGWALVLYGAYRLPADLERRGALLALGWVAALVSVPLWLPAVIDALEDADPSLGWAVELPEFGFGVLLCHTLARAALAGDEPRAAAWLRILAGGFVVVAVLPVLVFGAGVDELAGTAGVAVQAVQVALVWLLFTYCGRVWAGAPVVEDAAGDNSPPKR